MSLSEAGRKFLGFKGNVNNIKSHKRRRPSSCSECKNCGHMKVMNLYHLDLIEQQKVTLDMRERELKRLKHDKASVSFMVCMLSSVWSLDVHFTFCS